MVSNSQPAELRIMCLIIGFGRDRMGEWMIDCPRISTDNGLLGFGNNEIVSCSFVVSSIPEKRLNMRLI